jgi:hypothetical protein
MSRADATSEGVWTLVLSAVGGASSEAFISISSGFQAFASLDPGTSANGTTAWVRADIRRPA